MPAIALILLALCACASAPPPIRVPVLVPVLVAPNCEVPNSFEKCKVKCIEFGKRPTDSWEDGTKFECNCAPFDS